MRQGIVLDSLQCILQESETLVKSCHLRKSSRPCFDQQQQADEGVSSWLDGSALARVSLEKQANFVVGR
jgi:hypothetical protein